MIEKEKIKKRVFKKNGIEFTQFVLLLSFCYYDNDYNSYLLSTPLHFPIWKRSQISIETQYNQRENAGKLIQFLSKVRHFT